MTINPQCGRDSDQKASQSIQKGHKSKAIFQDREHGDAEKVSNDDEDSAFGVFKDQHGSVHGVGELEDVHNLIAQ